MHLAGCARRSPRIAPRGVWLPGRPSTAWHSASVSTPATRLCESINRTLGSLQFDFAAGEDGQDAHVLTLAGRPPVRFPVDAGGRVQGGSSSWVLAKHASGGIHEPGLVATLCSLDELGVRPRTVLDVGALYGYVSLVARSVFTEATVHAFEVNPRSYAALVRNVAANRPAFGDSVVTHHCALSDVTEAQVAVHIRKMAVEPVAADSSTADDRRRDTVDMWTLDDFCREHDLAPDLVKLDVEGFQAKIVPGAREVIARHRPVVMMEFDAPGAANDFGVTNREVIAPLMDDGYALVWGRHRSTDDRFQVLSWDELTDEHETNSLGILVP